MILIKVAVGVILNNEKNQIFLTKRKPNQHLAGFWEFPGGKVEALESAHGALIRELREEVNIDIEDFNLLCIKQHIYPDKMIEFHCFIVSKYIGMPRLQEAQEGKWIDVSTLDIIEMPEANQEIIKKLMFYLGRCESTISLNT